MKEENKFKLVCFAVVIGILAGDVVLAWLLLAYHHVGR